MLVYYENQGFSMGYIKQYKVAQIPRFVFEPKCLLPHSMSLLLSQINPVRIIVPLLLKIHFSIPAHLNMIFPTSFPTQDLWNNSLVRPGVQGVDCKGTNLLLNRFRVRCQTMLSKLTLCSGVLLEKLIVPQLVKKFLAFYKTRRFITVFTRAHHLSLS